VRHRIALKQSEEGSAVSVPGLPGCWSQGATEAEAIQNIKDAFVCTLRQSTRSYARREPRHQCRDQRSARP
jgi:predicted RNase H-like HicB family nuclease